MSTLTKKDVEPIARLSKIRLTGPELDKMAGELSHILGFVEKLGEMDLDGVTATSHAVEVTNVFREDKALVSPVKEEAFAQAPQEEDHFFVVPRVI